MKHLTNAFSHKNQWYRYLALFLASVFGGQFIGAIPLIIVIAIKTIQSGGTIMPNPENPADLSVYGIDPNLGFALMIIPFFVSLLVLFILMKPLHSRSYKSLFSGTSTIRWKRFFTATIVWTLLMAIYLIVDYSVNNEDFTFNFQASKFIVLVIVSLVFIPFQASYEEIMFRGYLAQGFAAWTKNRILVILFPTLIFGMMHVLNPEIEEYGFWLTMPQYMLFGLIFGLTTVLDDGVELAMGAHTANNLFLSLFVTSKASVLQTPSLLIQKEINPAKDLIILVLIGIVFVAIVSLIYKFKYRILTQKIIVEPVVSDMTS